MEPTWIQDDAGGIDMRISIPSKDGQWCPLEAMFILSYRLTGGELI